jgi:tRNA(adenine34) deaminase
MRERCSPCRSRLSVGIFARTAETQVVRWHREISIVTELDAHWMLRCEHLARQAARAGNTPVGALVVLDGKVVGEAAEEVPNGPRRFAHAELLAIEASLRATGRRSLETATLYTTAEPCILCGYAVREARLTRVVVGRPSGETGSIRSRFPILAADWVTRWGAPPEVLWWDAGSTDT